MATALLWAGFFLVNFNIAMMMPLLPFIQEAGHLTTHQAGLVLAAFPVAALLSNLALGPWIDRFGRRRFILAGSAAVAVTLAATTLGSGVVWLTLCRAATGLFMPMIGACLFAAIADYLPEDRRARAAGQVTTAAPIAFLAAISLGVILGGLVAWQVPLLLASGLAVLIALGAARLPPTPVHALASGRVTPETYRRRLLSLSMSRQTRLLFTSYFAWSAAVFGFLGLYPAWAVQRGLAGQGAGTIGTLLLLGEVGGLLGALLATRVRHGPLRFCGLAGLATALTVAVVPFGVDLPWYQALAYGGFAFGRDLMLALILGGAMLLVPAAERGSLNALLNAIYQTGATLGGIMAAWLYAWRDDFWANALFAGVLFFISALQLLRIGDARRR
ncbi:MFS transporter [Teichococcus deserti]|uniref:MFS transporter n=1 Tax=Teichococcus deserti TaxID=1817963 RepID=UPI000975400F|nr:MFS transporter [Pseudoroseomonas deserti]